MAINNNINNNADPRWANVEQAALQAIQQAHLDPNVPPVDVLQVATAMGVRVYEVEFTDSNIDGMVVMRPADNPAGVTPGERATIYIAAGQAMPRKKFTIAHELGHVDLNHVNVDSPPAFRGKGQPYNGEQEKEANRFAAALLMPAQPFARALYSQKNIYGVALTFGVSVNAASIRAAQLRLIDWEGDIQDTKYE
jgi:Zn-dependent peptidase ImmA (M78 family)